MGKTTIRKLLKTAVDGLNKEFLSEEDGQRMVDYLIRWSTQSVSNRNLVIASASMLGISKEQADIEINSFSFVSFYWGAYDVENKVYDEMGLPSREWMLKNHRDLVTLENFLTMDTDSFFDIPEGEVVVMVEGKVQNYKVGKHEYVMGMNQRYIEWETLEPYEIAYSDSEGIVSLTEYCNSRVMTELRVLQLLLDGATNVVIQDILSEKVLHWEVTETVIDSTNPALMKTRQFQWKPWSVLDDIED